MVLADLEVASADLRHRHPVGEQPDLAQHHPFAGGQRRLQAVGILRLDADHANIRTQVLDVGGDPGDQAAAADRHEDRVEAAAVLAEDLHRHRALSGDHVRIVVGWDEGHAFALGQLQGMGQRIGEGVAVQQRLAAARQHALDLELGSGARHHDHRPHAQALRRQGQALGMVAGGGGDHPAGLLLVAQARDTGVGAADLEGEHRLQVLALEQHPVAQALGQLRRDLQGVSTATSYTGAARMLST